MELRERHPGEGAILRVFHLMGDVRLRVSAGTVVAALHRVVGEERVFGARLSDRPTPQVLARLSKTGLSRREYEVLQLVGMGQTNPEIAELLGLTRNREDVPAQRDG